MKILKLSILSLAALGAVSCASVDSGDKGVAAFSDDARLGEKVDKICFKRNIHGFSNATRDTVVLSSGVNDDYLVEIRGVCTNLAYAQSIGVDGAQSCVRRGDYLIVSDSAFSLNDGVGMGPDRCYIDSIYKWDKDAVQDEPDMEEPES